MSTLDFDNINDRIDLSAGVPEEDREHLIGHLLIQSRQLSALSVLYSIAISDHLGLNLSDLMCLAILSASGPVTSGQLATRIGLSTGTVTGLVDRLERLDLVYRQRDEQDRRRIMIHLQARRAENIREAFVPMLESNWQHLEQFSDNDLAMLKRYMAGAIDIMRQTTREARERERRPVLPPLERDDPS